MVGLCKQLFNMTLHSGLFLTALLLLAVSGAEGQECANLLGTVDCGLDYANRIGNLTTRELVDINVFCGTLDIYKSCLADVCGGWDRVPQMILGSIDDVLKQYNLDCDAVDGPCTDYAGALHCGAEFFDRVLHQANQDHFNINDYCNMINDFRSCLVDACGQWDHVPSSMVEMIDRALDDANLKCDNPWSHGPGLASSVILTGFFSVVVLFFLG